jgi:Tol biopolymer transport system component
VTDRRPRAARSVAGSIVAATLVAALFPGAISQAAAPAPPQVQPPTPAAARDSLEQPGTTYRVSLTSREAQADGRSYSPAISANGRYVVFLSDSPLLGANAGAGPAVVLRDQVAGTTRTIFASTPDRVSTDTLAARIVIPGTTALEATISGNGKWVALTTEVNGSDAPRISIWDVTRRRLSAAFSAAWQRRIPRADQPSLSRDGRFLAFRTPIDAERRDSNDYPDVYVYDRSASSAQVVSLANSGATGYRGDSGSPSISPDGNWVAFRSSAAGLAPGTVPKIAQVYLRDIGGQRTYLVSHQPNGDPGSGESGDPSVSTDGRVVAFGSRSADLVTGDGNDAADVLAWDRERDTVGLVSLSSEGAQANDTSREGAVAADGRSVAFTSMADNLVPRDTNGSGTPRENPTDVFVHDLVTGRTSRVSIGNGPNEGNGSSAQPAISATGRWVAFSSTATNLVRRDTNKRVDVFLRDRPPALRLVENPTDFGTVAIGTPGLTRTITATSTGATAVRISGVTLAGGATADFLVAADGCSGRTLYPAERCEVQVLFTASAQGSATAKARFTTDAPARRADVTLRARVGRATLEIDPEIGPPGTVAVATGTGFPANTPVNLRWTFGITPVPLQPVYSDADGRFVAQVLVMPRDRTGKRSLVASVSLPGAQWQPPKAAFLVVPGSGTPPTSGVIQVWEDSLGRPILLRR